MEKIRRNRDETRLTPTLSPNLTLMLTLTLTLKEKCKSAPKQSIETHSAWYLIPPANAEDVDWDFFPEDIEFALPDETGFRGFIVEFYNVISGQ